MASTLSIDLASGADSTLTLRKLQTIVDGAVAPATTILAQDISGTLTVVFPADTASEQVLACFRALVNRADLPESGMVATTLSLTGDVLPGSEQRVYSV